MELETQLILGCAQTAIPPLQSEQISRILCQTLDWDYVLFTASRNGLLPILSWNLLENFPGALPPEIKESLFSFYQSHTQENLFLAFKLTEIVRLLRKNGIPVFSFKGATLAIQAYGNLALRHYVDLDILVQPKHFDKTINLLLSNGYKTIGSSGPLKRKVLFFTRKKDLSLISPGNRVRIELHWKLSGSHFALPFELNQLWDRLDKLSFGGTELSVFAFNDLFVYLCLHGSRHGWERIAWICDLRELIRSQEASEGAINWEAVSRHAKDYGCERVVELGLFLIQKFFNERVDYPDYKKIEMNKVYANIGTQIQKKLFSRKFASTEIGDWYLLHLSLKERKIDKLRLNTIYFFWYLKLLFKPNALDRTIFRLPTIFYPLYFIMRPVRLLISHFASALEKRT
jgi:hypothetical protein